MPLQIQWTKADGEKRAYLRFGSDEGKNYFSKQFHFKDVTGETRVNAADSCATELLIRRYLWFMRAEFVTITDLDVQIEYNPMKQDSQNVSDAETPRDGETEKPQKQKKETVKDKLERILQEQAADAPQIKNNFRRLRNRIMEILNNTDSHEELNVTFRMEYGEPIVRDQVGMQAKSPEYQEHKTLQMLENLFTLVSKADRLSLLLLDLKLDNILCVKQHYGEYTWILNDFDVSRLMENDTYNVDGTENFGMTWPYAAPEQVLGNDLSNKADVYAACVIAYLLLNYNEFPKLLQCHKTEKENVCRKLKNGEATIEAPCCGSEWLKTLILKGLSFNPDDRPKAQEILKEIKQHENSIPQTPPPPQPQSPNKKGSEDEVKKETNFGITIAVILAIVAIIAVVAIVKNGSGGNININNNNNVNISQDTGTQISYTDPAAEITEVSAAETEDLAASKKKQILETAEKYANSGDYASAIKLIRNEHDKNRTDSDYTIAENRYITSYKEDVMYSTAALIDGSDYPTAIRTLSDAEALIGDDPELKLKLKEYEEAYVSDIIVKAEEMLAEKDYDGAAATVTAAQKQLKNPALLDEESKKIESSRPIGSEDIMKVLSASVLQQSNGFQTYLGSESINVFAEDQHHAFALNTAVSYNAWGHEVQNVSFKISEFSFNTLKFTICGETGTSGSVTVDVFLDHSVDDGAPDYSFKLKDAPYPVDAEIDITDKTTLAFRVTNHANNTNRIVFYGFEGI